MEATLHNVLIQKNIHICDVAIDFYITWEQKQIYSRCAALTVLLRKYHSNDIKMQNWQNLTKWPPFSRVYLLCLLKNWEGGEKPLFAQIQIKRVQFACVNVFSDTSLQRLVRTGRWGSASMIIGRMHSPSGPMPTGTWQFMSYHYINLLTVEPILHETS